MQHFSDYHYQVLNDIHASRAFRQVVGEHTFTKRELDAISKSVGDMPTWDKEAQPRLVADTLTEMAKAYPYVEMEG